MRMELKQNKTVRIQRGKSDRENLEKKTILSLASIATPLQQPVWSSTKLVNNLVAELLLCCLLNEIAFATEKILSLSSFGKQTTSAKHYEQTGKIRQDKSKRNKKSSTREKGKNSNFLWSKMIDVRQFISFIRLFHPSCFVCASSTSQRSLVGWKAKLGPLTMNAILFHPLNKRSNVRFQSQL